MTDAYDVEPAGRQKPIAFAGRVRNQFDRPGFDLVTAYEGEILIGFALGYTLRAGDTHWWGGVQTG
ncbi:hypothetical protein GCM10009802_12820 [Streptomyces synnematoformans]|uniref:Uncharacterized protein n=1 Tax=Streptomyces synnematoformans TaxID=415721 RepID=A0ABN2XPS9_9ACTN